MKQLIMLILIALVSCKKQTTQPAPTPVVITPITKPNYTVTIYARTYGGQGILTVNWAGGADSTHYYGPLKYFTKVIQSDSISLRWMSQTCTVCPYTLNDITVTVNGIMKFTKTNDVGLIKYWVVNN